MKKIFLLFSITFFAYACGMSQTVKPKDQAFNQIGKIVVSEVIPGIPANKQPIRGVERNLDSLLNAKIAATVPTQTANNGLTKTANNTQLGGVLVQNTVIDGQNQHEFLFDKLGKFSVFVDNSTSSATSFLRLGTASALPSVLQTTNRLDATKFGRLQVDGDATGSSTSLVQHEGLNEAGAYARDVHTAALENTDGFKIGVKQDGVYAEGIGAKTTETDVLYRNAVGKLVYGPLPSAGIATASNGLTATAGDVKLGGTLSQNTTITGAGNDLVITGTASTQIGGTSNVTVAAPVIANSATGSYTINSPLTVITATGAGATTSGLQIPTLPTLTANPNPQGLLGFNASGMVVRVAPTVAKVKRTYSAGNGALVIDFASTLDPQITFTRTTASQWTLNVPTGVDLESAIIHSTNSESATSALDIDIVYAGTRPYNTDATASMTDALVPSKAHVWRKNNPALLNTAQITNCSVPVAGTLRVSYTSFSNGVNGTAVKIVF